MITLVTVTYNAAAVLQRTLASIAGQTCKDFEHLIIDGASTDNTIQLAQQYKASLTGGQVVILSEPDKGLYDAMNKGLCLAKGDYICFLNAGDKLHSPATLQHISDSLKTSKNPVGIIYGNTDIVDEMGVFIRRRRLQPPATLTWKSFRHGMLVCHQAFYVNRTIAQSYDLQYRFSADYDWCIRCMKEGERQNMPNLQIHEPLCDYLAEGMTTQNHKASLRERFNIMRRHYGLLSTLAMHLWFTIRAIKNSK